MFERFIAHRFLNDSGQRHSGTLLRIATASIALGVVVMILSVSILRGFQHEIEHKAVGFGAHLVVRSYDNDHSYHSSPIERRRDEYRRIAQCQGVSHVQCFAVKGGMIKTADQIHGILLKGIGSDYDTNFFHNNLTAGRCPLFPDSVAGVELLISQRIADQLHIGMGDKVRTYFWQDASYRARAFTVCGIYKTDLEDYDDVYTFCDLRQVQRLYGWDTSLVGGYEVLVDDFERLPDIANEVSRQLGYDLTATTIVEENPALFSWLQLLNSNIWLILGVMTLVCIVSIISSFLILVFEKTSTIGLLKVMGATNQSIKRIFLIKSTRIILKGIAIGDAVALLLGYVQWQWHIVRLDPDTYSLSAVPVEMRLVTFVIISLTTLAACWLALLLPATAVSRVQPAQTIKVS